MACDSVSRIFFTKRTCRLPATSPYRKVSCSAPMGVPTAADRIRNPGYCPTYSYGLAHPISRNSLMRGMAHFWLPSGTFIVKNGEEGTNV